MHGLLLVQIRYRHDRNEAKRFQRRASGGRLV